MTRRVLVLDLPGLSAAHFDHPERMPNLAALRAEGELHRILPVFPALTLPVQASLTTGAWPEEHGIVANGFFFPELLHVSFWEQSAALVQGERIWETLGKEKGIRTAALFLQNTLYADCDALITPKPLHTDDGLIPWCYSKPAGLYETIAESLGPFPLHRYWGPMAGIESSRWIASAALEVLARLRPELAFVYLPHLDYACQKLSPGDPRILEELSLVDAEVGRILAGMDALGLSQETETAVVVLSEYAFQGVRGDVPLNRLLREGGFLRTRSIAGREYLDMELSDAFAVVDHQVAHIYLKPGKERQVQTLLEKTEGIERVLDRDGRRACRLDHPRCGELVAVSARDRWFSYGWWETPDRAPDFASRVDIHRKPGYDPLELFGEPGTRRIAFDTSLVRGSHGYLPEGAADEIPLLISRPHGKVAIPEGCRITDVFGLIASMIQGGGKNRPAPLYSGKHHLPGIT